MNCRGMSRERSNAFMRSMRAAISRSDLIDRNEDTVWVRAFVRRRRRATCERVRVTTDESDEADEEEEEVDEDADEMDAGWVPRTFLAHLDIASSSFAAMAPRRPAAPCDEDEDDEEEDADDADEMTETASSGGRPPR